MYVQHLADTSPQVRALALTLGRQTSALVQGTEVGEREVRYPMLLGRLARSIRVGIQSHCRSNVERAGEPRQLVSVCYHYDLVEIQVGLLGLPLPHLCWACCSIAAVRLARSWWGRGETHHLHFVSCSWHRGKDSMYQSTTSNCSLSISLDQLKPR